jgi:hypothetical protein
VARAELRSGGLGLENPPLVSSMGTSISSSTKC